MYDNYEDNPREQILDSVPENRDGWRFKDWLEEVNIVLLEVGGVTINDIADRLWYDMWEASEPPEAAVYEALVEEGFPIEELDEAMEYYN